MLNKVLEVLAIYGYTPISRSNTKKWYNTCNIDNNTGCLVEESPQGDVHVQFHFSTFKLTVEGNKIGSSHVVNDTSVFHHAMRTIVEARELFPTR